MTFRYVLVTYGAATGTTRLYRSASHTNSAAKPAGTSKRKRCDEFVHGDCALKYEGLWVFGLDIPFLGSGAVNLAVLSGGRAVVQVNQKNG